MKVLVTGGAGFIGSNLVDALIERGDEVVVLDNLTTGRRANIEPALSRGAKLVVEDIRDADLVAALLEKEKPEVVFHLAAQIDVRVSTARPAFDAEINVMGTINMLEAARRAGTRRFVYASTGGAIYGETDVVPTPEDTVIQPGGALRPGEVRGRGLPRPVEPHARPLDGQHAVRQRLRPAPGPARRGRRDRDLLRQARDGGQPDRVRRRPPDARLRIRRGRRARVHDRRRQRRDRLLQRRPRRGGLGARARRGAARPRSRSSGC